MSLSKGMSSFFNSSKRKEVSNTSSEGDDNKRLREDSLNLSQQENDIFSESFVTDEDNIKVLINCIRNVEKEIKRLQVTVEDTKDSQIKGECQLSSLSDSITF